MERCVCEFASSIGIKKKAAGRTKAMEGMFRPAGPAHLFNPNNQAYLLVRIIKATAMPT